VAEAFAKKEFIRSVCLIFLEAEWYGDDNLFYGTPVNTDGKKRE